MTTLAQTILKELHYSDVYDLDFVERLIDAHQQQWPGSWQEWTTAEKTPEFVAAIKKAAKLEETSPARVLINCFA